MKKVIFIFFYIYSISSNGQSDDVRNSLAISGYLETYYGYDFGKPDNHDRPNFLYSYNRHNELNLNLGFIKAAYQSGIVRANLALMTGSYSNTNLASEPGVSKNIFESNVGVKLSKKSSLWLDAGIFPSHIGFESAIGKDCWNLTRSLLAENSPYYESGIKLSYTSANSKWFLSGLVLNGWQRIKRIDGNNTLGFGHQITYKPLDNIILNSSSFIGSDSPDSSKQLRYFHNFYAQVKLFEKLGLIAGFDIGFQEESKGSNNFNTWYSPVLILKYSPNDKLNIATRGEYYRDDHGVIIATGTQNGFRTYGYSINLDYNVSSNLVWRIEGRAFTSKDKIFSLDNKPSTNNYHLITSLALAF